MFSTVILSALLVAISEAAPAKPGSCKAGFLNTVFNTRVAEHSSWPEPIWKTLTSYGISNFITFTLGPPNQNPNFDVTKGHPGKYSSVLEAARIPIVMDPRNIADAQKWVSSAHPPGYLELFNEPDYSYNGWTPITEPVPSANDLVKLATSPHPYTTFLSPGLATPTNDSWLPVFFKAQPKLYAQIGIITMHIYKTNLDDVIADIEKVHHWYQDKRIWITEFGPYNGGGSGCHFNPGQVQNYAREAVKRIHALGYVDKIFWNCGDKEPAKTCDPSLTTDKGEANDLLKALGGACGFTG
ncbi:MAG: hypothetical protein Q9220_000431 [cf. Caloplaca sp. 1 TL-2023]